MSAEVLAAIAERVNAMPCDAARYAPDVMEWAFDGPCVHCELLTILDLEPPR